MLVRAYLSGVGDLRVVFDRLEDEPDPVEELTPVHPRLSHVEEDTKQDSERHHLEDGREQHRDAQKQGHGEGGQALVLQLANGDILTSRNKIK